MPVDHYENFPVASLLLAKKLRYPVEIIYHFARTADDIADEGNLSDEERLNQLALLQQQLDNIKNNKVRQNITNELIVDKIDDEFISRLAQVIKQYNLPIQLFNDLISAFSQDVRQKRYDNFAQLADYAKRSANPVGRLILHLNDNNISPLQLQQSDAICSALQYINFLQDVAIDLKKARIYLPSDELDQFLISENDLFLLHTGNANLQLKSRWQKLMLFQINRCEQLMSFGRPLCSALRGRLALEITMTVNGGLAILKKIKKVNGDVFNFRPQLQAFDWLKVFGMSCLDLIKSRI